MSPKRQGTMAVGIFLLLIAIDQIIKIYIKTHFVLRESVEVTSWFYLAFIENNGMAYGMEVVNKYVLTGFRIALTCAFVWALTKAVRKQLVTTGFVIVMAVILSGAVGNVIDCVFYGRWFTDSFGHVAQWADESAGLLPQGEWLKGRVVDMFYFPLIKFDWPETFPYTGELVKVMGFEFAWPSWLPTSDEPFMFFKPVFNFADACISVGVGWLVLFMRSDFVKFFELFGFKEEKKGEAQSSNK